MGRVRSLVPEQIAVRSCVIIPLIAFPALLPDRQRYRQIRIKAFDPGYDPADPVIRIEQILPALKHNRAKPQFIALTGTGQDLFLTQTVSFCVCVGPAKAAVIAVILTEAAELDQSSQKDSLPIVLLTDLPRLSVKLLFLFLCYGLKQDPKIFLSERLRLPQHPDSFQVRFQNVHALPCLYFYRGVSVRLLLTDHCSFASGIILSARSRIPCTSAMTIP